MIFSRVFWSLAGCAVLAACSGNLGGGQSTLPGAPQNGMNPVPVAPAAATATPVSASNVATVGDTVSSQALPSIAGWGGTIAFAKPVASPSASPSPNAKATPPPAGAAAASPVSVGITSSVVEPSDAPHFSTASAKRRAKHDAGSPDGLLFISLLATSDVAFDHYPAIAVDVPRDIVAKHRNDLFALALYDPEQKDKSYRLAVAERDLSSPAPGTMPSATPTPTPTATPTLQPNGPNAALSFTPPPVGTGLGADSLPPERVAFQATATNLTLRANRPVVFALYAVAPTPTPSPSPSAKPGASAAPAAASPSPTAAASASP